VAFDLPEEEREEKNSRKEAVVRHSAKGVRAMPTQTQLSIIQDCENRGGGSGEGELGLLRGKSGGTGYSLGKINTFQTGGKGYTYLRERGIHFSPGIIRGENRGEKKNGIPNVKREKRDKQSKKQRSQMEGG